MVDEISNIIDGLKRAFDGNENILLAYLYGSRARGRGSHPSDYDVAVLMKERSLAAFADVIFAVSKAFKVNEDKIDVLDLARAPLHLKAKVLAEGIKIVDRGYEDSIRLEVNVRHPEFANITDELLRMWVEDPGGLDLKVVKERLDYLLQLGDGIKRFQERHHEKDLSGDLEAWHALKSMVQDSVQAMIDICAHIFSSKNIGIAESYGDYIEGLVRHGHLDRELAERLKIAIAMRNRLTHRYLAVEPHELWDFASELNKDMMPKFREWVLRVVRA